MGKLYSASKNIELIKSTAKVVAKLIAVCKNEAWSELNTSRTI